MAFSWEQLDKPHDGQAHAPDATTKRPRWVGDLLLVAAIVAVLAGTVLLAAYTGGPK